MSRIAAVLFAGLLLTACTGVYTVNPIATEEIVFDPSLLGEWISEDGDVRMTLGDSGDSTYRVEWAQQDMRQETLCFDGEARLTRIGDRLLADFAPDSGRLARVYAGEEQSYFLPLRGFLLVERGPDEIRLVVPDASWLAERLEEAKGFVQGSGESKQVILYGSSDDLRRFLGENAGDPGLFSAEDPLVFRRR